MPTVEERLRYWRDRATAAEARIAELEASEKRMREALEPFSKMAGVLFERNFNKQDIVERIEASDGGVVTLIASHFFAARSALAKEGEV